MKLSRLFRRNDPAGWQQTPCEQQSTILDNLDVAIMVADADHETILFVNKRFRQVWGDMTGRPYGHFWQNRGDGGQRSSPDTAAKHPPDDAPPQKFRDPTNQRWYEVRRRIINWVDGREVYLETILDITERQQASEALEAAHSFQQAILDGMGEPLIVVGQDYRIKLMNRAARRLTLKNELTVPQFCYQASGHQTPCSAAGQPCPLEQVRRSGQQVTVVHEHCLPDGTRYFVEIIATPLYAPDGSFDGMIECMRDVTERMWAEEAWAEKMRVLAHSHEELEQFSYRVMRSIQDFFAKLPADSQSA